MKKKKKKKRRRRRTRKKKKKKKNSSLRRNRSLCYIKFHIYEKKERLVFIMRSFYTRPVLKTHCSVTLA